MNSAIKLVISAGILAALSWAPALAVDAPAVAATRASSPVTALLNSISCPSAGNCAAAGNYGPGYKYQAVVINDTNGVWGREQQVAGLASLPGGYPFSSWLASVSCSTAGNCGAGGYYTEGSASIEPPLVVDEKKGVWGSAQTIDMSHLKGGALELSQISQMSCLASGDCTATGSYTSKTRESVFVAAEQDGTWGPAENLTGTGSLSFGGAGTGINSLSCVSPGNCTVGGAYDGAVVGGVAERDAFVATETNGTWGPMQEVPGTAAVNAYFAETNSVSCTAGGNCTAVGYYQTHTSGLYGYQDHPFISSQAHGTWGPIMTVPGLGTLPAGGADLDLVWCGSAASCIAVGHYLGKLNTAHWFSITERKGIWGSPVKLRTGARSHIFITTMSCTSISNCGAGGYFVFEPSAGTGAFVISKTNGVWGRAKQVPGLNKINHFPGAALASVSCTGPGDCTADGYSEPRYGDSDQFIDTETGGIWGNLMVPQPPS
jgi:hypothetical protein